MHFTNDIVKQVLYGKSGVGFHWKQIDFVYYHLKFVRIQCFGIYPLFSVFKDANNESRRQRLSAASLSPVTTVRMTRLVPLFTRLGTRTGSARSRRAAITVVSSYSIRTFKCSLY